MTKKIDYTIEVKEIPFIPDPSLKFIRIDVECGGRKFQANVNKNPLVPTRILLAQLFNDISREMGR